MKKRYEFVFVLPGTLDKEKAEGEKQKLRTILTNHEASVVEEAEWGKKYLAYPIKHEKTGQYILWTLEAATPSLREVTRLLNFEHGLLRYALLQIA